MSLSENSQDTLLDFQLEIARYSKSGRSITHLVHDPLRPPDTPARYEVWKSDRRPIGCGGQGEVYLQKCDRGAGNYDSRAVKIIRRSNESEKQRDMLRELQTMARFSHVKYSQYFVRMLGWYFFDDDLYIAMEYLPRGDLQTYMRENSPLQEAETRQIIGQVVHGLAIMHKLGIAHRDIKPQNLLIQQHPTPNSLDSWWVKLADFGISKRIDSTMTVAGGPVGTPLFMAPELFTHIHTEKESEIDYRAADIWAVGVMIFYMLTMSSSFARWRQKVTDVQSASDLLPSPIRDIGHDGLDILIRLTLHCPEERPKIQEIASHPWVTRRKPELLPPERMPDSDDSSRPSSSDSMYHPELELKTLSTQLTSTSLGSSTNLVVAQATTSAAAQATEAQQSQTVETTTKKHDTASSRIEKTAESTLHMPTDPTNAVEVTRTPINGVFKNPTPFPDFSIKNSIFDKSKLCSNLPTPKCHSDETIHVAASKGNTERVLDFITDGVDMQSLGSKGRTPLHEAAANGHVEVINLLLDFGVDIEVSSLEGKTPLILAAAGGHAAVVTQLIDWGANIEARPPRANGSTSLMEAARKGHIKVVELLIDRGADIRRSNAAGKSALHMARLNGHVQVVEELLNHGADVKS